jgi:hypothetical protein
LIGRVALTLDANNPASRGPAEKALRAINPAIAKSEGDAVARDARAKKLLREMIKGEPIKGKNSVPGLGERWGRPVEQQLAIKIPNESFPAITEKIVRGLAYREDNAFIESPQQISCYVVEEEGLEDVKEMLAKHGKEFKREPGLVIRRAELDGGDLYEITFWTSSKHTRQCQSRRPRTPFDSGDRSVPWSGTWWKLTPWRFGLQPTRTGVRRRLGSSRYPLAGGRASGSFILPSRCRQKR